MHEPSGPCPQIPQKKPKTFLHVGKPRKHVLERRLAKDAIKFCNPNPKPKGGQFASVRFGSVQTSDPIFDRSLEASGSILGAAVCPKWEKEWNSIEWQSKI